MTDCKHCGEPILKFTFRDEGDQWWHANVTRDDSYNPPPGALRVPAPAYRRCHADPHAPYAEPIP